MEKECVNALNGLTSFLHMRVKALRKKAKGVNALNGLTSFLHAIRLGWIFSK